MIFMELNVPFLVGAIGVIACTVKIVKSLLTKVGIRFVGRKLVSCYGRYHSECTAGSLRGVWEGNQVCVRGFALKNATVLI